MTIAIFTLFVCYNLLFLLSLKLKDNSIVDIFWGLSFLITVHILFFTNENIFFPQIAIYILITLWSLRLSSYIVSKKLAHKGEDRRYAAWRNQWKYFYLRSYFQVYILQGILSLIISTALFISFQYPSAGNMLVTVFGASISLFGVMYETKADLELQTFLKIKKPGEILMTGLRKYHRYPQYFGEMCFWFGVSLIGSQFSIFAFASFFIIFLLLRFVSGVPIIDAHYEGRKGFAEYKGKVHALLPKWW